MFEDDRHAGMDEQPTARLLIGRSSRRRSRKYTLAASVVCAIILALVAFSVLARAAFTPGFSLTGTPRTQPSSSSLPTNTPAPAQTWVLASQPTPLPSGTPKKGSPPSTSSSTTPPPPPAAGPTSIYYGVHVEFDSLSYVTSFEADARKAVSLVMWYQQWGLTDGWQYLQPGWMNTVRAHGSIPLITWDPENPVPGGPVQPTYTLQNIINGNFDAYITRWAQDSKAWGHPFFLRFAHEMNGNWNAWSEQVNGNKPGQFVLAWRHVHDIFARQGVTNVTWVWSPNIDYSTSTPLRELYPGDSYVDWVGMSGYNWGNIGAYHFWQSFTSLFQQTYNDLLSLTSKPMMIAETASTEQAGNKAAWISDTFVTQLPHNFPRIRAFVWFNISKETDWRIESSASAQSAFASAIQSPVYASNTFAGLYASPIPPV